MPAPESASPASLVAEGSLPSSTTGGEDAAAAPPSPAAAGTSFGLLFSAVMLPMFMGAVDQTLLATTTPRLAAELGGLEDAAWVAVGYLMAATVTAPLYGRLGDRYGRRNVLLAALAVFVCGSLACGLASGMNALIASRVLQGLGGGGLMVLSQSLIGELVPPWERPRYQGYFAMVFTVSSVGGPLLGGFVATHGDWRWLFLANVPLGMLAAWRVSRLPKPAVSPHRHAPYDATGFFLFAICASATLLWVGQVGQRFAWFSPPSALLAGISIASGMWLARQQRRHPNPFLPLDVLRLPRVGWICLSVIGFAGTMFALVFLLPIYLHFARGASAVDAGLQLLPLTGGLVVGSTINARVSARTGRSGQLPPYGLGAAALVLAALALLPPTPALIVTAAAVCGIGFGSVMPSAQLATQMLAGRERLGASAALLSLTRSTGASLGTAVFGGLALAMLHASNPADLQRAAGAHPDALRAFHLVFGLLAVFAALAALAATKAPRMELAAPGSGRST